MKRSLYPVILLACCVPLAAAAQTPMARPQNACLQTNRIRDFDPQPDNRTIIVTDTFNHKYKVRLQFPCMDLRFRMSLAFRSLSGSRLACLDRNDRVIVARQQGMPGDRCLIDSVTAYTPDMEKADKAAKAMDRPH